ncbi:MAG: 3-methyl-2-oxobutanoate hydroxymethyltransferase [Marinilabiliales bacterium]|nr:3-methyl-2-oxobutanoate hydroxymethyltransferase [Marinilabiliales bacterium]
MLTAYDAAWARLLDQAGVDAILGGRQRGQRGAGLPRHAAGDDGRDAPS